MFSWSIESSVGLFDRCSVGSRFQSHVLFVGSESDISRSALEISRFMGVDQFIPIVAPLLLSPIVSCRIYRHVVNYFGRKKLLSVMLNLDSAVTFFGVWWINHFVAFELSY